MMTLDVDSTLGGGRVDHRPDVYDDVVVELRRVLKLGRAVTQRHVRIFDTVAPALVGVLALVDREGPMRTTDIAERLHVDVSVASRQLGELESAGLVDRHRDPADARAYLVAATAAGAAVVTEVRAHQREAARQILSDWDPDELRQFVTRLRRFGDDIARNAFGTATPEH